MSNIPKERIGWAIVAIVLTLVSLFFGISYPIPQMPEIALPLGTTHLTALDLEETLVVDGASTLTGNVAAAGTLGVTGNTTVGGTLGVTGASTLTGAQTFTGASTFVAGVTMPANVEHFIAPTLISVPITFTAAAGTSGVLATMGAGEVWIIHGVWANVTTNFDCTGDDVTFIIGDGVDVDGFLVLADAELQAADVEGTGGAAGWQGFFSTDTIGAYFADVQPFVFSLAAGDTIDYLLDETSGETITAGALTMYMLYSRII